MATPIRIARIARRVPLVAALTAASLLFATMASSSPAPSEPDAIVDNETVYVVADATGAVKTTVVVDWLQVQGTGTFNIADPAPGAGEIESLTEGFTPEKTGDTVVATVDTDGYGDYFYRAETEQELPLTVRVAYFLDGEPTEPDDLAGKSGRLRIDIGITNLLERTEDVTYENADGTLISSEVTYTVPLLCIPQLKIDGTRMTDIAPPDGAQLAITGSTLTYAIPMMPTPEATATIEMDARDIELASMIVSVFPTLPDSADFSVVDSLLELRTGVDGLAQLADGHLQVVEGVSAGMDAYDVSEMAGAADGIAQLTEGLTAMAEGADGLASLAGGQYLYLDGLITGIDTARFDALADLTSAITSMTAAVTEMEQGTAGLVALLDGQIAFAQGVRTSNAGLLAAASGYAAEYGSYSSDATALAAAADFGSLSSGLGTQDFLLDVLIDGGDPDGPGPQPYMPGLNATRDSLAAIQGGLTAMRLGLEEFGAQAEELGGVPTAFAQLRSALIVLRDGGDPDGAGSAPSMPGLGTTRDGLVGIASGLAEAGSGLAGSAGELALLAEMPQMMGELRSTLDALAHGGSIQGQHLPGLTTASSGLGEMGTGLASGVDQMREGEALMSAMKASADAYTSFLGLPEGATGQLSFLFKLEGVGD